jgi:hypothetical protein
VIYCLPLNIKKNVASVDQMESADTDLTVHEGIPCTADEIIEEIPRLVKTASYPRAVL